MSNRITDPKKPTDLGGLGWAYTPEDFKLVILEEPLPRFNDPTKLMQAGLNQSADAIISRARNLYGDGKTIQITDLAYENELDRFVTFLDEFRAPGKQPSAGHQRGLARELHRRWNELTPMTRNALIAMEEGGGWQERVNSGEILPPLRWAAQAIKAIEEETRIARGGPVEHRPQNKALLELEGRAVREHVLVIDGTHFDPNAAVRVEVKEDTDGVLTVNRATLRQQLQGLKLFADRGTLDRATEAAALALEGHAVRSGTQYLDMSTLTTALENGGSVVSMSSGSPLPAFALTNREELPLGELEYKLQRTGEFRSFSPAVMSGASQDLLAQWLRLPEADRERLAADARTTGEVATKDTPPRLWIGQQVHTWKQGVLEKAAEMEELKSLSPALRERWAMRALADHAQMSEEARSLFPYDVEEVNHSGAQIPSMRFFRSHAWQQLALADPTMMKSFSRVSQDFSLTFPVNPADARVSMQAVRERLETVPGWQGLTDPARCAATLAIYQRVNAEARTSGDIEVNFSASQLASTIREYAVQHPMAPGVSFVDSVRLSGRTQRSVEVRIGEDLRIPDAQITELRLQVAALDPAVWSELTPAAQEFAVEAVRRQALRKGVQHSSSDIVRLSNAEVKEAVAAAIRSNPKSPAVDTAFARWVQADNVAIDVVKVRGKTQVNESVLESEMAHFFGEGRWSQMSPAAKVKAKAAVILAATRKAGNATRRHVNLDRAEVLESMRSAMITIPKGTADVAGMVRSQLEQAPMWESLSEGSQQLAVDAVVRRLRGKDAEAGYTSLSPEEVKSAIAASNASRNLGAFEPMARISDIYGQIRRDPKSAEAKLSDADCLKIASTIALSDERPDMVLEALRVRDAQTGQWREVQLAPIDTSRSLDVGVATEQMPATYLEVRRQLQARGMSPEYAEMWARDVTCRLYGMGDEGGAQLHRNAADPTGDLFDRMGISLRGQTPLRPLLERITLPRELVSMDVSQSALLEARSDALEFLRNHNEYLTREAVELERIADAFAELVAVNPHAYHGEVTLQQISAAEVQAELTLSSRPTVILEDGPRPSVIIEQTGVVSLDRVHDSTAKGMAESAVAEAGMTDRNGGNPVRDLRDKADVLSGHEPGKGGERDREKEGSVAPKARVRSTPLQRTPRVI